jgi:uncharacterized membrane protein YgcG
MRSSAVLAAAAAVVLCFSPAEAKKKLPHNPYWKCPESEAYSMPMKVLAIGPDGKRTVIWQHIIGRPSCAFFQGDRYDQGFEKLFQMGGEGKGDGGSSGGGSSGGGGGGHGGGHGGGRGGY